MIDMAPLINLSAFSSALQSLELLVQSIGSKTQTRFDDSVFAEKH
jgi:hypothetical protein